MRSKMGYKGYKEDELNLVMQHLLKLNPDSVITAYSDHNEAIIQACKILGIPCIDIATNMDHAVESRDGPPDYSHFKIALPFDAPETIETVSKTTIAEQRFISGPPVRHPFTQKRGASDVQRFKEKWGIETNKKVVVISSGKNGAFSPYAQILAEKYEKIDPKEIPIHLVVICGGGNETFKQHLERNVMPHTKLPMTVALSYKEEQMEELMAMASYGGALVGKAGGATIFETFAKGTRILVDNVPPGWFSQGAFHFLITLLDKVLRVFGFEKQLYWEKANMKFAIKHGLAQSFKEEKEFLPSLEKILNNNNLPVPLNIEVKNIEETIPTTLRQMLAQTKASPESRRAREIHANL